jgi:hypothetical protein
MSGPVMGWSGRAPVQSAVEAGKRRLKDKEHVMPEKLNAATAVIGIDIGKNSFHVVGLDSRLPLCCGRNGHMAKCKHAAVPDWGGGLRRSTSFPAVAANATHALKPEPEPLKAMGR